MHQGIAWTPTLHDQLVSWIVKYYRDILTPNDLRDPKLVDESFSAIEILAEILGLPNSTLLDA
jgi:succinylarginine dihydrolase